MVKDRSVLTKLRSDVFNDLHEQGQVVITKYLKLAPYPRNRGIQGFAGIDKNMTGNSYLVYHNGKTGKFISTHYYQFNGEVYFRFPTVMSTFDDGIYGSYRKYIVEIVAEGRSYLCYLLPGGGLRTLVENAVRTMTDKNCYHYVWRAHRMTFGKRYPYQMDLYYRDDNLKQISHGRISSDHTKIINDRSDNNTDWYCPPKPTKVGKRDLKIMGKDRVASTVQHIKDKILPMMDRKPEPSDYISWFVSLAGETPVNAKLITEHRDYYALP